MNFTAYINEQRGSKIKADTLERWNKRIVPRGLNKMGADGAVQYLSDY